MRMCCQAIIYPLWQDKSTVYPVIARKGREGGKGVGLPCYRVAAVLLSGYCAFRRKRTWSGFTLARKLRAMSQSQLKRYNHCWSKQCNCIRHQP